jgi:hypothetical protein
MDLVFMLLNSLHTAIYLFAFFAFLTKETAFVNLYGTIPILYILQILPNCPMNTLKKKIDSDYETKGMGVENTLFGSIFANVRNYVGSISFRNPLSDQGFLILCALTSAFRLQSSIRLKI